MIELRMRGVPPALFVSATIAAAPAAFVLFVRFVRGTSIDPALFAVVIAAAFLPWASRALGRFTYRAAVDDIALHVAGEALPWNTITKVTTRRSWRRTVLVLARGQTTRIELVTLDVFAGRLEPIDELERRLPTAAG